MLPYVLPKERTSPQVAPKTAYLISSGDLLCSVKLKPAKLQSIFRPFLIA